jgi:hypothetical protein
VSEEQSLEEALAQTERDAESAIKTASALVAQAKRIHKFAQVGSVRDLAKAMELAQQLAGAARDALATTKEGWRFDATAYLEAGKYTREVLALANARGVTAEEQDGRIVCYPSLLRVLPSDEAVEIDRKKSRDIRPSRVVGRLQTAQTKPPKFRPEPFLEALLRAYLLLGAEQRRAWEIGEPLRLSNVYKVLTVLPGSASAYSIPEFTRDIYLLDESRLDRTKDGLQLSLPASSGGREGGALRTVTRNGSVKTYYSIAFRQ